MQHDRSISTPRITTDELLAGAQVLLVEEDIAANAATAMVLRSWGCAVTTAFGFDDAAKVVADQSLKFDVIITDFRRQKYTGVEIANGLRELYRWAISVLTVSGEVAIHLTQEVLKQPYFLSAKAVAVATLRVALTQLLKTKIDQTNAAMSALLKSPASASLLSAL